MTENKQRIFMSRRMLIWTYIFERSPTQKIEREVE